MMIFKSALVLFLVIPFTLAYPAHFAKICQKLVDKFLENRKNLTHIPNPPGPLQDDCIKMVNDPTHPYIPPKPTDLRGPCPGLNTLANHNYLPRSGVARPDQLITAVMEGYNLGNDFAKFLVYQAHLLNGNPLTNLISIGGKTSLTGPDPPKPAAVGGLSFHGTFEGDTSMTRVDAFFGNQATFNETLFKQFTSFAQEFGANGTYDMNTAAELRHQRLQQSIQNNPNLSFVSPRILSAYSEAVFPTIFFVDGRLNSGQLNLDAARSFFDTNMMPTGFHRQPAPVSFPTVTTLIQRVFDKHPFTPGINHGVNNFTLMPETPALSDFCGIYEDIVLRVLKIQYPNPTGQLRDALNTNLEFFYSAVKGHNCTQVFPFGTK